MIELRKSGDRGHFNHGWLSTFHSFSFAEYHDPQHMGFGPLRVINEDWIAPDMGFGMHGHRDMEIVTYVLEGELEHQDSIGNGSIIRPGNVQRMSAGSGVRHSERNSSLTDKTHLLQIWIEPNVIGVEPGYEERQFSDAEKNGQLRLIASHDGSNGSVTIHQDAKLYVGLFDGMQNAEMSIMTDRLVYVHVARGSVKLNGIHLLAGDAAKLVGEKIISISGGEQAEVLVFDLPEWQK
jgi:redox-sensitive bicupin YhaK (pirin superfamily)